MIHWIWYSHLPDWTKWYTLLDTSTHWTGTLKERRCRKCGRVQLRTL